MFLYQNYFVVFNINYFIFRVILLLLKGSNIEVQAGASLNDSTSVVSCVRSFFSQTLAYEFRFVREYVILKILFAVFLILCIQVFKGIESRTARRCEKLLHNLHYS